MEYLLNSFSPLDFSKNFAFGLGVGVGIGVVIRKLCKEKNKQKQHVIACLKQLAAEVRQLRETILITAKNYALSKSKTNDDASSDEDDEFFDAEKGSSSSESIESFLERVDSLFGGDSADQQNAYNMLITKSAQLPDDVRIMWRYAKSQYQISALKEKAGDRDGQRVMIEKGLQTAKSAISLDQTCYQAHQWYSILLGVNIQFQDTKEKIMMGYEYKEHIEKAIELNPEDATSHYLLGRYCLEVYMLPWYMRKAASALFAEPPTATIDDALACFLKAEEIRPSFWVDNPLYIGKCYYNKNNYNEAKKWLKQVSQHPAADSSAIDEANNLLCKC